MSVFVQHLNLRSDSSDTNALDIDCNDSDVVMTATSHIEIAPTLKLGAVADVEAELGALASSIAAGNTGSAAASALVQSNLDAYEISNDTAVAGVSAALTSETAARGVAISALNTTLAGLITTESTNRASAVAAVASDLAAETSARESAILGESTARASAVSGLTSTLDANRAFLLGAITTEKNRIDGILSGTSVSLDSLQEIVTAFQAADSTALSTITQIQSQLTALQATVDALTEA